MTDWCTPGDTGCFHSHDLILNFKGVELNSYISFKIHHV